MLQEALDSFKFLCFWDSQLFQVCALTCIQSDQTRRAENTQR